MIRSQSFCPIMNAACFIHAFFFWLHKVMCVRSGARVSFLNRRSFLFHISFLNPLLLHFPTGFQKGFAQYETSFFIVSPAMRFVCISFFFVGKLKQQRSEHFTGTELATGCQHRLRCFVSLGLWFWLSVAQSELWKEWPSFIGLPNRGSPEEFTTIAKRVFFILQSLGQLYFGQTLAKSKPPGLRLEAQMAVKCQCLLAPRVMLNEIGWSWWSEGPHITGNLLYQLVPLSL